MLESENLSEQGFEEILSDAVSRISEIYPEWTNHNATDPGIMVLELFSWMKEVQQYHMNRVNRQHFLRYLGLLGEHIQPVISAKTYLRLSGEGEIPAGLRFYADSVPFETERSLAVSECNVTALKNNKITVRGGDDICFYPFGENINTCTSFSVVLSEHIPQTRYSFYFDVGMRIQSADDCDLPRYVKLRADCRDGSSLLKADILYDETFGLLRSGILTIECEKAAEEKIKRQLEFKFTITEGKYAVMPVIRRIYNNVVPASQRCTLAGTFQVSGNVFRLPAYADHFRIFGTDGSLRVPVKNYTCKKGCVTVESERYDTYEVVCWDDEFDRERECGTANGLCNFEISVNRSDIIEDSVELYTETEDGQYFKWERVETFDMSDKYSRHFVTEGNRIIFGDGEHGLAPRGKIYIASVSLSIGGSGNIKAMSLRDVNSKYKVSAINITEAEGGMEAETAEACFKRIRHQRKIPEICATTGDYEEYIRQLPGIFVKRVKAFKTDIAGQNEIVIAMELFGDNNRINLAAEQFIMRCLNQKKPIGTKIYLMEPEYAKISIFAEVESVDDSDALISRITKIISDCLDSDRLSFGAVIRKNDLIRAITENAEISAVRQLDMTVSENNGKMSAGGDVTLREHCIPKLEKAVISFV